MDADMITCIEAKNSKGDTTRIDIDAFLANNEVLPADTCSVIVTEILDKSEWEAWKDEC
jgi:hypothetical protein